MRSVAWMPGCTELTVTPSPATSRATVFRNPVTPARAVFDRIRFGIGWRTATDVIATTRPQPWACIAGTAALHIADDRQQVEVEGGRIRARRGRREVPGGGPPALVTRMSRPPSASVAAATNAAPPCGVADVVRRTRCSRDRSSAAASRTRPSSRPQITTRAPSAASARADPRPSPADPAATAARLPCSPEIHGAGRYRPAGRALRHRRRATTLPMQFHDGRPTTTSGSTPSPMPTRTPTGTTTHDEPDSNPTLVRTESCDLCIVGGGYTGLWTAIIAKERDPSRDVVLIDAHEVGSAASGRNGGFMESSLTHGVANGQERFPDELADARGARPREPRTRSKRRSSATASTATTSAPASSTWRPRPTRQLPRRAARRLRPAAPARPARRVPRRRRTCSAMVHSPTYTGGLWRKDRAAIVDPARLAWGLKAAAESLGVRIYEDTKATALERDGVGVLDHDAARTGAGRPGRPRPPTPSRRCCAGSGTTSRRSTTTCSVTEPLTAGAARRRSAGRAARACPTSRTSSTTTGSPTDNRILWGGYDAVYFFGGKVALRARAAPGDVGQARPRTSSRPSRSSRASSSPTPGAG